MKKVFAILIGCMLALPITAQVIKQYRGEYPNVLPTYWYGSDPTAVYSYYEDPSGNGRVFHGPFKFKFYAGGSTSKKTLYVSYTDQSRVISRTIIRTENGR